MIVVFHDSNDTLDILVLQLLATQIEESDQVQEMQKFG